MQYFGPKIRFLIWDRDFRQWTVCSPRRWGRFGAFGQFFDFSFPSYGLFRGLRAEKWPFLAIPTRGGKYP